MKPFVAVYILTVGIGIGASAWAADSPDEDFYKDAAQGGMAEVQLGQLAQERSHNAALKEFGALMVKDHTAANDKLKTLADTKGVDLPAHVSVGQMATRTRLQAVSDVSFDRDYAEVMVKDHEEDIKAFEKEAKSGKDADARAFATATLPTLKEHLRRIRVVASQVGLNHSSTGVAQR